jgi:KUP system potassium uptake protein
MLCSMSTSNHKKTGLFGLGIGALGIVYGDIGTSPLYAVNEIFFGHAHVARTNDGVIGVISLLVWALILVIGVKYMSLILRADNDGEGGITSLYALLHRYKKRTSVHFLLILLILAAGFLYGDGIITPAISVLSATEGIGIVNANAGHFVIPATLIILTLLFLVQKRGTAKVGAVFGPIMLLWFLVIGVLGLREVIHQPVILQAFNPLNAVSFAVHHQFHTLFVILGSIMLALTGGEAVFADMGHFGKLPIRLSWFIVVMPALLLNYLGQGALLLSGKPIPGDRILYGMAPTGLLIPMVVLATMATVIASQALISGAYSLTAQAIALDLLPKLRIKHTSNDHEGQIYVGFINWALYLGCIIMVLGFRSSSALAVAYGLAVTVVMVVSSISMILIARLLWSWSWPRTLACWVPFILIDVSFLAANSLKFLSGGYVPLAIGVTLCFIMTTWLWGRKQVLDSYMRARRQTVGELVAHMRRDTRHFPKSVLVLTGSLINQESDLLPAQLQLFFDKFGLLPTHIIVLTVNRLHVSHVEPKDRYRHNWFILSEDRSFLSVQARFGYMENVDMEAIVRYLANDNSLTPDDDLKNWLILAGRERISHSFDAASRFNRMRYQVFKFLNRNTLPSYEFYGIAEDQRLIVENVPVRFR